MEGLTSQEVAERKAKGLANDADVRTSRTYTDIFVKNTFTPFNVVLFIIGILLVVCDEVVSAVSATGIIIANILISTIQEMRSKLDGIYCGEGMPYPFSYANEVVTKGVCIFSMVKGDTKDAILAGVNMGRDTDCVAAVAAGISGALTGGSSIPASWIEKVDHATSVNPYTNSKRTLQESADVLYDAYVRRLDRLESYAGAMRY